MPRRFELPQMLIDFCRCRLGLGCWQCICRSSPFAACGDACEISKVVTTATSQIRCPWSCCQSVQAWIHEAFVGKGVLFGRVYLCATLAKLWKTL